MRTRKSRRHEVRSIPTPPGRLTVLELDDDSRYVEVAEVSGDEMFPAVRPFTVTVVPARLLDGLRPG